MDAIACFAADTNLPFSLLGSCILALLAALLFAVSLRSSGAKKGEIRTLQWYKTGLPLLGPPAEFQKAPEELLLKARKQLGNVFGLNLLAKRFVFVLGPDAHRWFFNADDGTLASELSFERAIEALTRHLFGAGLYRFTAWNEKSRKLIITGLASAPRSTYYTTVVQSHVERSLAGWAQKGTLDLFRECSRVTMGMMIACLLGDDVNERFPELVDLYYEYERMAALPAVAQFLWFPSAVARRFKKVKRRIVDILETVIRERYTDLEGHSGRQDYLQFVLNDTPGFPEAMSLHFLTILFAAHINTVSTMAWTIAHIASDEALQRAVGSEVRSEGDPFRAAASAPELAAAGIAIAANKGELPLLDKCMRETHRLYGNLLLVREVQRPTSFSGVPLPKGTTVAFSPFVMHRDESVYENASTFNPHRFSKPALEELTIKRQYVPFGSGRHACQGQRLVTIVLRLVWTTLFRDYDVSVENAELPAPEYAGALGIPQPKSPVFARVRRREGA